MKFFKIILFLHLLIFITGCSVVKIPQITYTNKYDGVVEMSYEYDSYQTPNVNWNDAINKASLQCKSWGYNPVEDVNQEVMCSEESKNGNCRKIYAHKRYKCSFTKEQFAAKEKEADERSLKIQQELTQIAENKKIEEEKFTKAKSVKDLPDGSILLRTLSSNIRGKICSSTKHISRSAMLGLGLVNEDYGKLAGEGHASFLGTKISGDLCIASMYVSGTINGIQNNRVYNTEVLCPVQSIIKRNGDLYIEVLDSRCQDDSHRHGY